MGYNVNGKIRNNKGGGSKLLDSLVLEPLLSKALLMSNLS